ncbi:MAG: hypothetical protein K9N23_23065, partial [Akkermansiaceae bacterium]|nr:hypothetical protein [Akkermansiaceae bacterium]
AWLKEGEQAFLAGNLPGMKTMVEKILAKEPKSAPGRMVLARHTPGSGQTATADQLLQEIAGDKSLWSGYQAQAWGLRAGLVLEQAGKTIPQLPQAEQPARLTEAAKTINDYANQALALNANQPEAHLTLAMLAAAGGQAAMQNAAVRADIRKHLDAALTANPGHVQALMMRFQLNGMESNNDGAITDATALLKAASEIHQVRVMLIQLLAQARRWPEAWQQVEELQKRKVPQADQIRTQLQQMQQAATGGGSRGGKK